MEDDDAHFPQRAIECAFGDLSDSSGDVLSPTTEEDRLYIWESVEGIDGLWLCREFLSDKDQNLLLSAILREGWFTESSHNQAMRFGDLPSWATDLSRLIQKAVCFSEKDPDNDLELDCEEQQIDESGPLPFNLLWREPLFDQLITNVYQPGNMRSCRSNAIRGRNCYRFDGIGVCYAFLQS
ncbi:uncharacterized protein LOC110026158 isoform X4 [Phalaenopsis equestris]|uniref:uncharacterized protein LOC110026158 isoform X4 n=1 Tax=Phalaenopsis equestris TaxID=78828 RepID=UPI0009E18F06|nr:uncharacterized protein LOC110026158 isoform X4 [Phalaenopsis equestris]